MILGSKDRSRAQWGQDWQPSSYALNLTPETDESTALGSCKLCAPDFLPVGVLKN